MSPTSRREVLEQARLRYGGRGKAGRSRLLDEICALCGYERTSECNTKTILWLTVATPGD